MEQQIKCEFSSTCTWVKIYKNIYTCSIKNQEIGSKSTLKFIGGHEFWKNNNSVLGVSFKDCKIREFPKGLMEIFPNLQYLEIHKSELKSISRDDLKEYKNLKVLWLDYNEIVYLPADLFQDLNDLEIFYAFNSKIEIIEPNIFENCSNLKYVNLERNICIDKCFSSIDPTLQNATLEEIKEELKNIYPSWEDKVKNFKGEITSEVLKLIKEFSEKEEKLQREKTENDKKIEELQREKDENDKKIEKIRREKTESDKKIENLQKELSEIKMKFEHYETIMENEELKDFTIKTEFEEFKAHKFVLAAHSPTFAKLISENVHVECLNLLDVSTNVFRVILDFMYTKQLPENNQINFIELFIASERLKIESLKKIAGEKLLNEINAENALEILKLGINHKQEELRKKSFEEIKKFLGIVEIDENLGFEAEKLKVLIEFKKEKERMMKEMEENLKNVLGQK